MTFGPLHHIGHIVPSVAEARRILVEQLGGELFGEPVDLEDGVARIGFVQMPGVLLELIEPIAQGTDLTAFLEAHPGGGQHHVCYQVPDIEAGRADCAAAGLELLTPVMTGVLGLPIFFVRMPGLPGLLVEFIEVKTS